jgi:carbon monoxide dehydrogenase subunit G
MQVEHSIEVDRPIEAVFAYITNPENIKELGMKSIRQTSAGPVGLGATFTLVIDLFGRDFEIPGAVTEYRPYEAFTLKTTSGPFEFEQRVRLTPLPDGTRVEVDIEGDPGKALRMAGPLLRTQLKKQLEEQMAVAKDRMEGQL